MGLALLSQQVRSLKIFPVLETCLHPLQSPAGPVWRHHSEPRAVAKISRLLSGRKLARSSCRARNLFLNGRG